jgi:hypothetical protein
MMTWNIEYLTEAEADLKELDHSQQIQVIKAIKHDAIHLAAALGWQGLQETPVTLATFDRELWLAAKNTNMPAWPEALPVSRG